MPPADWGLQRQRMKNGIPRHLNRAWVFLFGYKGGDVQSDRNRYDKRELGDGPDQGKWV